MTTKPSLLPRTDPVNRERPTLLSALTARDLAGAGARGAADAAALAAMPGTAGTPAEAQIEQIKAQQRTIDALEERLGQAKSQREELDIRAEIDLWQRAIIAATMALGPAPGAPA